MKAKYLFYFELCSWRRSKDIIPSHTELNVFTNATQSKTFPSVSINTAQNNTDLSSITSLIIDHHTEQNASIDQDTKVNILLPSESNNNYLL